jgi:CheY-like chemotaxis protein
VNSPLAVLFYEDLMPGSQLANRLQDLKYRVQVAPSADELTSLAASAGPMLCLTDLASKQADICAVIRTLRGNTATAHLPIIAFADEDQLELQESAKQAGATLVVSDAALLAHLAQFIEQALRVE